MPGLAALSPAALPTCSVLLNLRAFAYAVPTALLYLHVSGYNLFQENFSEPLAPLVLSEQPQHIVVPTPYWHELCLPCCTASSLRAGVIIISPCAQQAWHIAAVQHRCCPRLLERRVRQRDQPTSHCSKRPFTQVVLTEPLPCAPPHKCRTCLLPSGSSLETCWLQQT